MMILSMFAEMRQLRSTHPELGPQELLEMVTVNAAAALRQTHSLGRIRKGFAADLIAIPLEAKEKDDVLSNLLAFEGRIALGNGRRAGPEPRVRTFSFLH